MIETVRKGCGPLILVAGLGAAAIGGGALVWLAKDRFGTSPDNITIQPISVNTESLKQTDRQILTETRVVVIEEGSIKRTISTPLGPVEIPGGESKITQIYVADCEAGIDHMTTEPEYIADGPDIIANLGYPEMFGCRRVDSRLIRGEGLLQVPVDVINELERRSADRAVRQAVESGAIDKAVEQAELREASRIRRLLPEARRVDVFVRRAQVDENGQRITPVTASPRPSFTPTPVRR